MPYMLLVMEPPGQRNTRTDTEGRAVYAEMVGFAESLQRRGVLQGVQSLRSDADAVRVKVRNGERVLIDGPFAESKEMVGGFFLLDVPTREEAVAIAAQCPAAKFATIEVREFGACYE